MKCIFLHFPYLGFIIILYFLVLLEFCFNDCFAAIIAGGEGGGRVGEFGGVFLSYR